MLIFREMWDKCTFSAIYTCWHNARLLVYCSMNPDKNNHQTSTEITEEELLKVRQTFLDSLSMEDLNPKWAAPIENLKKKKKAGGKSSENRAKK